MNLDLTIPLNSFGTQLDTIESLNSHISNIPSTTEFPDKSTRIVDIRVAVARGSTLLVAASLNKFVIESAEIYTNYITQNSKDKYEIPSSVLEAAITNLNTEINNKLGRKIGVDESFESFGRSINKNLSKLEGLFRFIEGKYLGYNISEKIISTRNNLIPKEIDIIFKISGIENFCERVCELENGNLKEYFKIEDSSEVNRMLCDRFYSFFDNRNDIAHSHNKPIIPSPKNLIDDIGLFRAFATDLVWYLQPNNNTTIVLDDSN